ncbi:MAG: hypothetical protein J5955_06770 [Bacilli bacterium]|nr:hypothetical protein [Bacilli bacterium]
MIDCKPGRKQADPLTKDGIVGAFNRTYSISEAIDVFLGDIYEEAGGIATSIFLLVVLLVRLIMMINCFILITLMTQRWGKL